MCDLVLYRCERLNIEDTFEFVEDQLVRYIKFESSFIYYWNHWLYNNYISILGSKWSYQKSNYRWWSRDELRLLTNLFESIIEIGIKGIN